MTLNASVTDDQLGQYYRRTTAIADRLGKSLTFEKVMDELQRIHDGLSAKAAELPAQPKVYLRRLYETETITVGGTLGIETIPGLCAINEPTPASGVVVDEQIVDGTYAQLFESKGANRRRWSRSQVAKFVTDNPGRLRGGGYGNFFELEEGSVAYVIVRGGEPSAGVCGFSHRGVWRADCRYRVFSLQQ